MKRNRRPMKQKKKSLCVFWLICFLCLAVGIGGYGLYRHVVTARNQREDEALRAGMNQPGIAKGWNWKAKTVSVPRQQLFKGELILVNAQHAYHFPAQETVVSVYENKNTAYKVSNTSIRLLPKTIERLNQMLQAFEAKTGIHEVMVTSGYRSQEKQQAVLDEKAEKQGITEARRWAASPGYSEHHTGFAVDFGIYTDSGRSLAYTGAGDYAFLNRTAYRYGFIVRYAQEKSDITGIDDEPWHFRYVGVPHAYIMRQKNLCLEEYIDYVRAFSPTNRLRIQDDENFAYEIYFVSAQNEESTAVQVPVALPYRISGNNVDGFIVTVELGKSKTAG